MASELWLSQVAIIVSLVGMSLGWRGVMTRYSGFYDLTTAWSMMFWGILVGGLYGSLGDLFLLTVYIEGNFLPYSNLIICLGLSVAVHLFLRRKKVRRTGSQPTTGWALGLAVGGMISLFLIFRLLQANKNDIGLELIATIILVALISPRAHALIFCRHGYGMLMGRRWSIVLRTFFWTALLLTALYSSFYLTRIWIFIIPPVLLAEKRAHDWVWAAVPRPARRRLRRIWSDASRSKTIEEE
ncbi:MAG: hypothetical protein MKZ58_05720 [Candidatus Poseidoniaceae archaeon]|nr:hypothetical protein [Candidatus Poseidoniaceae archaeon]RAH13878.1 MAG: hypothetical protein CMB05_000830 [Euryarchaeota archaeon]|tara:strand:+ start:619 stop:1344 length:726 start_codon:yes stop_codon:yes gene_type:complete